jgi:MarR family transcriptional regulator, lower aerobic nicotinate degradation pathway regulator
LKNVLDALRLIVRDLRLSAREAERVARTTGAQLFVLQELQDNGTLSLGELAERTMTDQSSVSVVVKKLASAKLVTRKPSRADARRLELSLTPAGKKLLARCPEPTQVRLVAALKRLAPGEIEGLTSGLTALVREMGLESTSPPAMFFEDPSRTRKARR